jgi:hypothetical protein
MQLRNMPETQAGGQFVAQERLGMVQGGHGLPLLAFRTTDHYFDIGVPAIGADVNIHDLDGQEARIVGFKADDFRELFPDRFRDPQCAPFIHSRQPFQRASRQFSAEQFDRFIFDRAQHPFGVDVVGRHRNRGDRSTLP